MWQARVAPTCIGSGSCQGVAAEHFAMSEDNHAVPRAERFEPDDVVLDAAAICPVEAITIIDLDTGRPVEP